MKTQSGLPLEVMLSPGAEADPFLGLAPPLEEAGLHLVAQHRKNSKAFLLAKRERKRIETVQPEHVHAVTAKGFELKVFLTVLAFTITATL